MIWLSPLALIGAAAVAAPILIHILVQRRAERFAFPTLRFLQPTRLAAIRRHVLEDLGLLVVRAAIVAGAAVALAGPLLVTPARRAAWNARIVRAVVQRGPDLSAAASAEAERAAPRAQQDRQGDDAAAVVAAQTTIETVDLRDGIARAVAWLDAAPPAKRELLIVSTFVLGSLTRADLNDVPPDVGIRLERSGQPPATRSFAAAPIVRADLASRSIHRRERTIELDGPSTSVRDLSETPAAVPIEVEGTPDQMRAAEATLAAVLSQRVPAPASGRSARVVFATVLPAPATPPSLPPWIANAIARIATDGAMRGADGASPAAVSTDGSQLIVTTTLPPADLRTALIFRSIFDALSADDDRVAADPSLGRSAKALAEREVLAIPDEDLRAWERPASGARSPNVRTIDRDDRRWWWAAVLVLLALETLMRRARPAQQAAKEFSNVA